MAPTLAHRLPASLPNPTPPLLLPLLLPLPLLLLEWPASVPLGLFGVAGQLVADDPARKHVPSVLVAVAYPQQ